MVNKIRVLVVDDVAETRESIRRLLEFMEEIEIVGEAGNGSEALAQTGKLHPDLVIMDVYMPEMDGIRATELMAERYPETFVILMSVQSEQEYLLKAMQAGARDYLVKPFSGENLSKALSRVFLAKKKHSALAKQAGLPSPSSRQGRIITFFSTKGGVGKTTLAVNLAVALAHEEKYKVLLIDLDLQFGDCAVFLNTIPKHNIADLAQTRQITGEEIKACLTVHSSGVDFLAAPLRPEYAETVTADILNSLLELVKVQYDFIILDTANRFEDISLAALDAATEIWLVLALDLPALKNTKISLDLMDNLGYTPKIKLVLNRADGDLGMERRDTQKALGLPVSFDVLSDGKSVVGALNAGKPFVIAHPLSRACEGIYRMVADLTGTELNQTKVVEGGFGRVFAKAIGKAKRG